MPWPLLQSLGLILVVLVYLLVTCVLGTLAAHRKHAIDVHDRVRASRVLRLGYLQSLSQQGKDKIN